MSLEKVRDILKDADRHHSSVIAYDAFDYNTISSAIEGAARVSRPVIVMLYPSMDKHIPLEAFVATVRACAAQVKIPVGLHLDHCSDYDYIVKAMRAGFTSVMADGSSLPMEENIAFTARVVRAARLLDVDVEGELGHVGSAQKQEDYQEADRYTRPEDAKLFAETTGVASLAVAIGSAHGFYTETPKLDIGRLKEIDQATDVPLVLHGGSGIPEDQLVEAFKNGINKFNVGTEYFWLNSESYRRYYEENPQTKDSFGYFPYVQEQLRAYIARKCMLTTYEV